MTTSEFALIISILALIVSLVSLWANNLKPFELKASFDSPTFRLYKISPQISGDESGKSWWIPSFDMGFSFCNVGKRPGAVLDIRIICELSGYRNNRKFIFYPKWIVNYSEFKKNSPERFRWIKSAITRDWYSLNLGASDEKDVHVILEGDRWDYPEKGEMTMRLEIASSTGGWQKHATYKLPVTEDMFEGSSSYSPYNEAIEKLREST